VVHTKATTVAVATVHRRRPRHRRLIGRTLSIPRFVS
jgi:hypothetical protein